MKKNLENSRIEDHLYRLNVGVVVFNKNGQVLVGERVDYPDHFQFPQGGIDENENTLDAAYRELREETSITLNHKPIFELDEWLYYDFPKSIPEHLKCFKGQKQKWLLFYWDGEIDNLDLDIHEKEFRILKWMEFAKVVEGAAVFKKNVYEELIKSFEPKIKFFISTMLPN